MSRNYFNKGGGGQGGPPNMGWPGLYGYQGYQGQGGQYGQSAGARGGYNRQGPDRSSEYFVNDEVVGASSSRERQAPPAAHAGSQHQGLHGMQPWAGVPPSAHAAYAGFPPAFGFGGYGAYGGWEGYSQVAQAYGQMMEKSGMMEKKEDRRDSGEQKETSKERQHFPSSSSPSASAQQKSAEEKPEPIVRNDREEREIAREHPEEQPDQRFETKSSPEVKSEDRDIKTPTDMKYDLLFPPRSAQESSRKQEPPSSPTTSTHSTEMISPTSRRKQASPQKKLSPPDAPGGATVLITHAGRQLSPDRGDSPPMKSSPAKPEMEQSPAKSEYDQNSQRSPAKSTTSNMSEDMSRSNQHSPERARLEIHHLIEKEDFSSSSEVSDPPQESTPQRRKSKAEMKEYVVPREGTSASPTKVFKKVEEDLEAMFSEKSGDIKAAEEAKDEEDNAKDESNIESSDQPDMEMETNKPDFQKVEDDLEAMFGGLEEEKEKAAEKSADPEKKKRGRKPKAAKAPEPEDEEVKAEQVNPVNIGRATSKRKSAQNAEMRMKDDMDDILDQIINRKKPKKISSSSAQPSIDEAPSEVQETANEAQTSSKVETKDAKPEKVTKTKSKDESTPGQPDFVPKYKKTELTSSKDETKNNDTENIFDFQDSEDDSSVSRQKPRDKKVKKVDTFDGILSKDKQPKERSSKIKLKQGRHGKIATEVSPEKPAELKFTKPYEKKTTEDPSKEKTSKVTPDLKGNQTSVLSSEKSKAESTEEKVKSLAERRSRRSKGEVKVDAAAEDSLAAAGASPLDTSPPPAPSKDSPQPSLILDTRRAGGSRRASTDSILVKEDEIEARRSRQRKWEDLDKGVAKPAEKEAASLTPKGKPSKSAESIMLEGSEEIKRIFDESLKNKDSKAEDAKQVNASETQSKEAPVSPKVRGRLGRRGKASEPSSEPQASEPVEEAKPESTQEVAVRSSRRSKGADVAAESSMEPTTELAESTSRASRRNKVAEAVTGRAVAAAQEAAVDVGQEAGGRPSRRSRGGQETTSAVESDSTAAAGKAAGKGSDGKGKIGAAAAATTAAAEKEKVEEVTTEAAEPADDSTLSKADASKSLSKKLEIKINKLDLQDAMPRSNEGSKVDLGGLMSRYPGLLLAASKDTKEKEKEALGSPTEPEGRRSRRNRRSSDMSTTNKDEIAGGSQDLEVSGRGRKRKVSSEVSQLHLPAGIEVVKIEESTPTPEKVPSDAPTRRRSRRGSDGINEDPVVQMEVEDSILTDGLESVADTSNVDSANVSASQISTRRPTKLPLSMFSYVFFISVNKLFR